MRGIPPDPVRGLRRIGREFKSCDEVLFEMLEVLQHGEHFESPVVEIGRGRGSEGETKCLEALPVKDLLDRLLFDLR